MSGYLTCITNTMFDVRSCTVRDQHLANCDGYEHRYREVWDPETRRNVWVLVHQRGGHVPCAACAGVNETFASCPGCVPERAAVGCVCLRCWRALTLRWSQWEGLEPYLARYAVLSPRERSAMRSPQGPRVPLPATFLAWEEVRSTLAGEPQSPESWVSRVDGAAEAVRFTYAVAQAVAAHQYQDRERLLVRMRCTQPGCNGRVAWFPPSGRFEPMTVKCEVCKHVISEDDQWTAWRRTYEGEWEKYQEAAIDVIAQIETGRKA